MENLKIASDFLREGSSIRDVERYYHDNRIQRPKKPKTPQLYTLNPSDDDVLEYLTYKSEYPKLIDEYEKNYDEYSEYIDFSRNQIFGFIHGIVRLELIPDEYRDNVISCIKLHHVSYENYYEMLNEIIEEIFAKKSK